jgi:hypothetical protein
MHRLRGKLFVFGCLALLVALAPLAMGGVWDKKTTVSFTQPVEVPGAVLEPGTYVMKLLDSSSNRHIVQFWNEDQNHMLSMAFAIPAERIQPAERTILTFYEMPSGQPDALKTWFYPGDNVGQEFTYPKNRATQISAVTGKQVPATAAAPSPQADVIQPRELTQRDIPAPDRRVDAAPAPPVREERAAEEPAAPSAVEEPQESPREPEPQLLAQNAPPPAPAPPPAATQAPPAGQAQPPAGDPALPATASGIPTLALLGLLSIGAGYGVRKLRRLG